MFVVERGQLFATGAPKWFFNLSPICDVADFGFAQYLRPGDFASSLRGSPLYMAPEMLLSDHYDNKVDLWSVGIIMYGEDVSLYLHAIHGN